MLPVLSLTTGASASTRFQPQPEAILSPACSTFAPRSKGSLQDSQTHPRMDLEGANSAHLPERCFHMIRENGHLRYLKTVRVTAGVCQGLARLKPGFTHWYWPGLKRRTNPFGLAPPYVFVKQSDPPCHCDLHVAACAAGVGTPSSEGTGLTCRIP